jgi:hypothetical protein
MTMKAESADGVIHEFPDGTTPDVIDKAMKSYSATMPQKSSGVGDFFKSIPRGLVEGAAAGVSEAATMAEGPVISLARAGAKYLGADKKLTQPPLQTVAEKASGAATERLPAPEDEAGKAGETTGRVAGNPLTWLGPGGPLMKAGTAALTAAGQWAGGALTRGTKAEPYAEAAGGLIGGVGAAGTVGAVRGAVAPKTNVAADLARAMERDGTTPEQLQQALQRERAMRPNATLADVGGENVRGLVERIAQTPGAGRTKVIPALTTQQQQQITRISGDLASLTGTSKTATQAITETMAARKAAADPLYDQAMNFNARQVPEITNAWTQATSTGWGKQVLNSSEFRNSLQTEYGIADAQNAPLMQVIDSWKKHLDGIVGAAVRSGDNNIARVISEMRDRVIGVVDQHNPAYAAARAEWAGASRYLDAIEDGRNILSNKMSAEELSASLAAKSDSEREAFRIGAVAAIRGKMGNDPARLADMTKYLRSPEVRAKIAAIMPTPEAAEAWATGLNFEVKSSELTGRALGNSATARRLAERQDADNIMGDLVMGALAHGPTLGLLKHVLMSLPNRVRDTLRSRSDNLLADVLLQPNADVGAALKGAPPAGGVTAAGIRSTLASPLAAGGP